MLHRRRAAPEVPAGHGIAPPPTPELRDRFFRKVQWNDEDPVAARGKQDEGYKWQAQVSWAEFWSSAHAGRDHGVDDVFLDLPAQVFDRNLGAVLGGDDHRVDALGDAAHVLHADLALARSEEHTSE